MRSDDTILTPQNSFLRVMTQLFCVQPVVFSGVLRLTHFNWRRNSLIKRKKYMRSDDTILTPPKPPFEGHDSSFPCPTSGFPRDTPVNLFQLKKKFFDKKKKEKKRSDDTILTPQNNFLRVILLLFQHTFSYRNRLTIKMFLYEPVLFSFLPFQLFQTFLFKTTWLSTYPCPSYVELETPIQTFKQSEDPELLGMYSAF